MFTPGFKFYAGIGVFFLVATALYGWTSGGVDWGLFPSHLGPLYYAVQGAITAGWRGGIGDHVGYVVLLAAALTSFMVAGVIVAFRDADAEALAAVAGTPRAP